MTLAEAPLPLGGHALFQSTDLDEARERVAAVFCPHRLDTIGRHAPFGARHHHLAGTGLSLHYIQYWAKPLAGGAAIANGEDRYASDPQAAAVLNPHRPTTMIWEAGTRQILVQIDRRALMEHLSAQLGTPAEAPLTFSGALDLSRGAGAALRRLVLFLVAEADAGRAPLGAGLMARQVESLVMAGLIEAHRHDYAGRLGRAVAAPRPRHLRVAEDLIEGRLAGNVTLDEVAEKAGISTRGLQMEFRAHRGKTPLEFWRDLRLKRAHQDLMAGQGSVTEVALRWGFAHFGRFAETYRRTYGLSPRDTLRAAGNPSYQD